LCSWPCGVVAPATKVLNGRHNGCSGRTGSHRAAEGLLCGARVPGSAARRGSRKSPPERLRELFSVRLRNSERACAVVAMLCVCARPERQSFAFVGGNGLVGSCGRDTSARPGAAPHFARPWAAASGPRAQTLLGKDGFTVWRAALEVLFRTKQELKSHISQFRLRAKTYVEQLETSNCSEVGSDPLLRVSVACVVVSRASRAR